MTCSLLFLILNSRSSSFLSPIHLGGRGGRGDGGGRGGGRGGFVSGGRGGPSAGVGRAGGGGGDDAGVGASDFGKFAVVVEHALLDVSLLLLLLLLLLSPPMTLWEND